MKQLLIFFLFLTTNAFSRDTNDSSAIVRLLVNDYKTMGTWDIKAHVENCTNNYLLVEDGEIWDIKKETDYYITNATRVIDRKDYFDIKYVRVYGAFAYAVYNLRSDIVENGNLKVKNWLESVILRKIKGKWKIELINSTPVDLKK